MASEASSDHLASRMFTPRARSQPVGDRAFRLRRLASVAAFGVAAWLLAGFTFPGLPGSLWAAALGAAALAQGSRAAGGAVVLGLVLAGFTGSPAAGREVVVLLAFALVELARHRPSPNGPGASLGQAALLLVLQGAVGLPTALAAGDGLEAFKTAVGPALAIAAAFLLWVPLTGPAWAGRPARLLGLGLLLALGAGALWRWTGTPSTRRGWAPPFWSRGRPGRAARARGRAWVWPSARSGFGATARRRLGPASWVWRVWWAAWPALGPGGGPGRLLVRPAHDHAPGRRSMDPRPTSGLRGRRHPSGGSGAQEAPPAVAGGLAGGRGSPHRHPSAGPGWGRTAEGEPALRADGPGAGTGRPRPAR